MKTTERLKTSRHRAKTACRIYGILKRRKEKEAVERLERNPDEFVNLLFSNPLIAAQANNELVFAPDYWIGHSFPSGKEFIGEDGFISFTDTVERIKRSGKKVILNVGDSSTSGWNSDIVRGNKQRKANGERIVLPFFSYKTYSDCLRKICGDRFLVLNAGVPAHSSLQGLRRLKKILEKFKERGVQVDFVTTYYGNNDCAWNGNLEDVDLLPKQENPMQAALFDEFVHAKLLIAENMRKRALRGIKEHGIVTRVSPRDYRMVLERMVETCRTYGTAPVLIKPVIPIYWEPGRMVKEDELKMSDGPGASQVYSRLGIARAIRRSFQNQDKELNDEQVHLLCEAAENDFITPRIKQAYVSVLMEVAGNMDVPVVDVGIPRTRNDGKFFVDYCHPLGEANIWLAEGIHETIRGMKFEGSPERMGFAMKAIAWGANLLGKIMEHSKEEDKNAKIPDKTYPLY
jgi:hypothetical protein